MNEILEYLSSSLNSQIISLSIGLIGIFIAIFFYLKQKRDKIPTFSKKSYNLINDYSNKIKKLEVFYSGQKVRNLTITKFAFWNDGNKIIKEQDIAPADPFKVIVDNEFEIFEAEILPGTTKEINKIQLLDNDSKSRIITFDFLSYKEGAVLQVIHSGLSSKDIDFKGTIMGEGRPKEINYIYLKPINYFFKSRKATLVLLILLLISYLLFALSINEFYSKIIFGFGIIVILLLIFVVLKSKAMPKEFVQFTEEK